MKTNKSANDWLQEMMNESFSTGNVDEVPDGWINLQVMAQKMSLPITTMHSRVNKLIKLNKLHRKKFRIDTGRGITAVWHYSPTSEP